VNAKTLVQRRKATTVVEFACVASLLFLFLFGVVEYVRLTMVLQLMNNAAREGARAAVVNQSTLTTAQIQNVVTNYLAGESSQLNSLNVQVYWIDPSTGTNLGSWTSAGFGQAIAVQVNGNFTPLLPTFLHMGTSMSLQARAVMYSEAD
jgi:Flp pilus assembly protein TadG